MIIIIGAVVVVVFIHNNKEEYEMKSIFCTLNLSKPISSSLLSYWYPDWIL